MVYVFNFFNNIFKFFERILKKIYKIIRILIFFAFTSVFLVSGLIILFFVYKLLLSNILKEKDEKFINKFFYDCVFFFVKIFLDTFVEVKIWGKKNINFSGPKIFASNHFSSTDPFFVLGFMKERLHMIIGPTYTIPVLSNFMNILGHINALPENRKNVIPKSLEYINKKESVYIFPEGDLNDQENFLNFYSGVAKIYIESNGVAPIIPIGLLSPKKDVVENSLFKIKVEDRVYKNLNVLSGRYLINIGEPVHFKELISNQNINYEDKLKMITESLKQEIKKLIDEAKFEKYWD